MKVWGIHTKDDNLFIKKSVIAIGWSRFGDLRQFGPDKEKMKEHYAAVYPEDKAGAIPVNTGQLYRFAYDLQEGDYVVYPSKLERKIYIGKIISDYYITSEDYTPPYDYIQRRKVKWIISRPRTDFSQAALYEVGSAMSIFQISKNTDEFLKVLDPAYIPPKDGDDETITATADEIEESTKDFIIKTLLTQLKGYPLEDFVANLLKAMGYRTTVSKHGGDSGIDIVAYKDELPPRILVQVKSKEGNVTEATLQSLKGAMKEGDYGLFVTLSDYTKNAQKYLDNTPIIRGINGPELADLILKYYEELDGKYHRMLPLKKVYIPVIDE